MRAEGGVCFGRFNVEIRVVGGVGSLSESSNFLLARELGGGCDNARDGVSTSVVLLGDIGPTDLLGEDPV